MQIMNDGDHIEYCIPPEIKERIPDYFYTAFAGELFSVYGWARSKMMFYPKKDKGCADLESSSAGWVQAFLATCRKLEMQWLADYYEALLWYDSDVFDGIIEQEIYRRFMIKEDETTNDYYRYLVNKEKSEGA